MTGTVRAEAAFKLALAIVLAYWIALSMGWEKPYWAGISIIACSLTSFGESVNKGLLRLGGTSLAITVSVVLLSLFSQDRWLFVGALGLWLAVCCYRMFATSRPYFWKTAAFVVPVLVIGGGGNPVNDFTVMILRAQQTILGILCFSFVYAVLWPVSSRQSFEVGVQTALSLKRRLLGASMDILNGNDPNEDIPSLRLRIAQQHTQVEQLLDAAILDSYQIWDRRRLWRHVVANLTELDRLLQRLYLDVLDLKDQADSDDIRVLKAAMLDTDRLLSGAEAVLSGHDPAASAVSAGLPDGWVSHSARPHFQRAALSVATHNTRQAHELAAQLTTDIADLKDCDHPRSRTARAERSLVPSPVHTLDPDMWMALIRVQVIYYVAVFCVFFVPGFPNDSVIIPIAVSTALGLVFSQQASVSMAMVLATVVIVLAGAVHMMVLPALSAFWQLAVLIFATSFGIAYFTSKPSQMILRSMGLNLFLVGLQTDNHQSFSFLFFAVMAIGLFCVVVIIEMTRYFPFSLRPERRVEALIKRFFRCAEKIVRSGAGHHAAGRRWVDRLLLRHRLTEIDRIPAKLVPWINALPGDIADDVHKGAARQIPASLEALSSRILELVDARPLDQAASLAAGGEADIRRWRDALADIASEIADDPGAVDPPGLNEALRHGIAALEQSVEALLNRAGSDALADGDLDNMYRVLGAYRGLTEGVIAYGRRATDINWMRMRESRF